MSEHTPGPWTYRKWGTEHSPEEIRALGLEPVPMLTNDGGRSIMAEQGRVAVVDSQTEFKRGRGHLVECSERDANADLISASPDLLDTAIGIDQIADDLVQFLSTASPLNIAMRDALLTRVNALRKAIAKAKG